MKIPFIHHPDVIVTVYPGELWECVHDGDKYLFWITDKGAYGWNGIRASEDSLIAVRRVYPPQLSQRVPTQSHTEQVGNYVNRQEILADPLEWQNMSYAERLAWEKDHL